MARPKKTSLTYFPFDVDFFEDERLVCISGEYGWKGELTAVKLLCAIYKKGYYLEWSPQVKFKLVRDLPGVSPDCLDSIVARLADWGFFDAALFRSEGILTGKEIQECYFTATKRCVRPQEMPFLVEGTHIKIEKTAEMAVSATETGVSVTLTPPNKIKGKEIKENKIKENTGEGVCAHTREEGSPAQEFLKNDFFIPTLEDVKKLLTAESLQEFIPTVTDAKAFVAYYGARDWKINGQRIRDWRMAFASWLTKKSRFSGKEKQSVTVKPIAPAIIKQNKREVDEDFKPADPAFVDKIVAEMKENLAKSRNS